MKSRMTVQAFSDAGYLTPRSPKKAMKGITATANSPDVDINGKLEGMRALSRDLFMNSPLAASIIRRHRSEIVGTGLQLQSRVDRVVLGLSDEAAEQMEAALEREFDLWADSFFADYSEQLTFAEIQAVALLNVMLSGDVWFVLPWDKPADKLAPFATRVKMIDADLVRDPATKDGKNIEGGVELDDRGRPAAIHVWNTYSNERYRPGVMSRSERIPVYDSAGRRQVWQIADFERIGQRRGVPLLASAVEPLKQLTRLSEAQLMNALVSSFLTVFVRSQGGISTLAPAFTPEESAFGGGRYGPTADAANTINDADANDLEMGYGNVLYLDDNQDVTIADPRKVDTGFQMFWEALGNQVTAAGGMPFEKAMMKYTTSYTAARAAAQDAWKVVRNWRGVILAKRLCGVVFEAVIEESAMRGRLRLDGFFDNALKRRAWLGAQWVGSGQGAIDPLKEARATQLDLENLTTTYEEAYLERTGGRWDAAMNKRARENRLLKALGIVVEKKEEPAPTEEEGETGNETVDDT